MLSTTSHVIALDNKQRTAYLTPDYQQLNQQSEKLESEQLYVGFCNQFVDKQSLGEFNK